MSAAPIRFSKLRSVGEIGAGVYRDDVAALFRKDSADCHLRLPVFTAYRQQAE